MSEEKSPNTRPVALEYCLICPFFWDCPYINRASPYTKVSGPDAQTHHLHKPSAKK